MIVERAPDGARRRRTDGVRLEQSSVPEIREILHRRTDLSTFVVHLTRGHEPDGTGADALASIARGGVLEARSAMGWAREHDEPDAPSNLSQRVVCFSETPLEHIHLMAQEIPGRAVKLEPYGVALTKMAARRRGVSPVWYVNMTPGFDWTLSPALNDARDSVVRAMEQQGLKFHQYSLARLFPFFEGMGTWPGGRKEFWWEREWRHVGDFTLPTTGLIWLCPEDEIDAVRAASGQPLDTWIDPRWGLEAIIAHLAGFDQEDITPFAVNPPPEMNLDDNPFPF